MIDAYRQKLLLIFITIRILFFRWCCARFHSTTY